jgi:hypothetical protein
VAAPQQAWWEGRNVRFSSPRHLAEPSPARAALIGLLVLFAVTVVIGGLLALALTGGGAPARTRTATPVATGAPPSEPPATVGGPTARPALAAPTTSSPPLHGTTTSDGNLLRHNPSFEDGLNGWHATTGTRLEQADTPHDGHHAARLTTTTTTATPPSPPPRRPGMLARHITRCQPHGSYTATAWVQATWPSATIELNLIELVNGQPLATDIAGHLLPDHTWQHIEVDHVTHHPGAELAIEIIADNQPDHAALLVDTVEVHLTGTTSAFTPRTTQ